jgi:hypothetical protein
MHKVGAEDRKILLEPRHHRLTDTKRLNGFLIGTGKQVFVVRGGQAEHVAKTMGQGETHGCNPFRAGPPTKWGFYAASQ